MKNIINQVSIRNQLKFKFDLKGSKYARKTNNKELMKDLNL